MPRRSAARRSRSSPLASEAERDAASVRYRQSYTGCPRSVASLAAGLISCTDGVHSISKARRLVTACSTSAESISLRRTFFHRALAVSTIMNSGESRVDWVSSSRVAPQRSGSSTRHRKAIEASTTMGVDDVIEYREGRSRERVCLAERRTLIDRDLL